MAIVTLGTATTTTLSALLWDKGASFADVSQVARNIRDDNISTGGGTRPVYPGAFSRVGTLYIPNRGFLNLEPGDYVAYDNTGWPILLSNIAAAGANWVHT